MADKKKKKKKQAAIQQNKQTLVSGEASAQVKTEVVPADTSKANVVNADAKAANNKKVTPAKKPAKKAKKPGFFARFGKKIKEVFSELKKVTWPSFQTVIKQTGIVLAVVAFFLILVFLFDFAFSSLYTLIFPTV